MHAMTLDVRQSCGAEDMVAVAAALRSSDLAFAEFDSAAASAHTRRQHSGPWERWWFPAENY